MTRRRNSRGKLYCLFALKVLNRRARSRSASAQPACPVAALESWIRFFGCITRDRSPAHFQGQQDRLFERLSAYRLPVQVGGACRRSRQGPPLAVRRVCDVEPSARKRPAEEAKPGRRRSKHEINIRRPVSLGILENRSGPTGAGCGQAASATDRSGKSMLGNRSSRLTRVGVIADDGGPLSQSGAHRLALSAARQCWRCDKAGWTDCFGFKCFFHWHTFCAAPRCQ
ncbi:hypothetical protein Mesau_05721 [Mesorhizobium australicum WSM2073]|uniref:Uncharacterized protein n=3 Tax=Mesorhizobium TaxID=68287 RepID=L0KRF2_MESAW|nr:hypothetical protein Mesci_5670 [Mesorhizobium ciceri biovar biserrulae WSM1271]AEH90635.1 hypothetical protein Mesop_6250 [Mesorhizobium opportunistum WSM2075]AGB48007.1 hypothetical protein Mesau_05721 [Mesorhizobium australicum WSM2073]